MVADESGNQPESFYRDLLAAQVGGTTELILPFGRADVVTAGTVYEVEPVIHWRDGVRQVLSYAAQCSRRPALALYGKPTIAVRVWTELERIPGPGVELWWLVGSTFASIPSEERAAEVQAAVSPCPERARPSLPAVVPGADCTGLLTLGEIAVRYGHPLKTVTFWSSDPAWPAATARRGRWHLYPEPAVDAAMRDRARVVPDVPGPGEELLDMKTVAAEAGLSWPALRSYVSRGQWPAPDDDRFGVKRWKRATVRAEMASRRPARGRTTGGTMTTEVREMAVACLLLFGDDAELELEGAEDPGNTLRCPAAVIATDTGLELGELPGRRFLVRVSDGAGAPVLSGFRLAG
jgi:hypothetical protein